MVPYLLKEKFRSKFDFYLGRRWRALLNCAYEKKVRNSELFRSLPIKDRNVLRERRLQPQEVREVELQLLIGEDHPRSRANDFFRAQYGHDDLRLENMHIVPILKLYREKGEEGVKKEFRQTAYFQYQHYLLARWKGGDELKYLQKQSESISWDRFKALIRLYHLIEKTGYLSSEFENHFIIVRQRGDRFEVISGHHRASILIVLGAERAKVLVVEEGE